MRTASPERMKALGCPKNCWQTFRALPESGDNVRTLDRNKQAFYYALYRRSSLVIDSNLNYTSEVDVEYETPVLMEANISPATGNAQSEVFGSLTGYDRVIVTDDMTCPIDEQTVLFVDKVPEAQNPVYDYVVKRVAKSLNSISIAITKVDLR